MDNSEPDTEAFATAFLAGRAKTTRFAGSYSCPGVVTYIVRRRKDLGAFITGPVVIECKNDGISKRTEEGVHRGSGGESAVVQYAPQGVIRAAPE